MAETRPWPLLPSDGVTLHHISDTHWGYRHWSHAEGDHVLGDLEQGLIGQVAALVHTGDIIDGPNLPTEDAYAKSWLGTAAAGVPSVWAMGNHDLRTRVPNTRASWEAVYGRSANTFVDVAGYRIITWAVDEHGFNAPWIVPPATWAWLAETIEAASGPVILAQHFPPHELGATSATNSVMPVETFSTIVGDYPQVVGLLCGHIHTELDDWRAAKFVVMGGRSVPCLSDISTMLSLDGASRDRSAQFQSISAYVTLFEDRWEVRYRLHGTHAWGGPQGQRVTTMDLADGTVTRSM